MMIFILVRAQLCLFRLMISATSNDEKVRKTMTMKTVMLFGGHMSIELPEDAQDISQFREIPDNQEVYTHSVTDQSIIIEILEYVEQPDMDALKTHYEDIAGSNEAESTSDILNVEEIPLNELILAQCKSAYALKGRQVVSKFKETAKNTIHINVGLLRLPEYETDLVISFNNPVNINPDSTSHSAIAANSTSPWSEEQFARCVKSLKLLNPALFGGP